MTSLLKWEGTATAVSSIAHGAESLGTITYLRRERFLTPEGVVEEVPVISGNAWRGLLRDTAADMWWEAAGSPLMSLAVMHALWSGGALAKVSGPLLTGSKLQELRETCPVVSIFGTAGGGRIIGGSLQVGKMIPICKEVEHVLPEYLRTGDLLSMWDLTQIEYYSRIPNEIRNNEENEESLDSRLARYGTETFIAGTKFATWCSLTWPSKQDESFFSDTLAQYTMSAHVGGMSRVGHGQLQLELSTPEELDTSVDWRSHLTQIPRPRLLEALSWLD